MIDWKLSAEINNMGVDKLRARFVRFPQSNKIVVAICDGCGKARNLKWQDYNDLCNKCSVNIPDAIEANRTRAVNFWSDPKEREKQSERKKCLIRDNPNAMEAIRFGNAKYFSDPANRIAASDTKKQYHADNPQAGIDHSARLVLYYKDNAEARKNLSESMKNSDARKAVTEKQVGGNDIVGHHMIYDHLDLSKNIMYMTRSMHMRLHQLFRKHGIDIPHINTGVNNSV